MRPVQRHVAFATEMGLGEALRSIRKYQDKYNHHFDPTTAVNFRLIGATVIGNVGQKELEDVGVSMIESLKI